MATRRATRGATYRSVGLRSTACRRGKLGRKLDPGMQDLLDVGTASRRREATMQGHGMGIFCGCSLAEMVSS